MRVRKSLGGGKVCGWSHTNLTFFYESQRIKWVAIRELYLNTNSFPPVNSTSHLPSHCLLQSATTSLISIIHNTASPSSYTHDTTPSTSHEPSRLFACLLACLFACLLVYLLTMLCYISLWHYLPSVILRLPHPSLT